MPSITGHGRLWADVAKTEHRGAVDQHGHRVRLDGVVPHQLGRLGDRGADPADTRGVGHREIVTSEHRKLRRHLDLAADVPVEHPVGDRQQLHTLDCASGRDDLEAVRLPAGLHLDLPDDGMRLVLDDVNGVQEPAGSAKR